MKNKNAEERKPYVSVDEFGFIAEELKAKDRWAGVRLESYPKFLEVIRVLHVDLKTGWGASADDPDSLTSFSNAVHALRSGKIHHFVYLPDSDDDMAEVDKINRKLCPVSLPPQSQPTYKELLAEDPMHIDFTANGSVNVSDLVPHLTQVAMLHYFYESSIVGLDIKTIMKMLNDTQREDREKITFDEDWVRQSLSRVFQSQNHITVYRLLGDSFRVSRMTESPPFPRPTDIKGDVWYQIERLT